MIPFDPPPKNSWFYPLLIGVVALSMSLGLYVHGVKYMLHVITLFFVSAVVGFVFARYSLFGKLYNLIRRWTSR